MQEKRNLWRTTLECNKVFLFIYIILLQTLVEFPRSHSHGSVPAVMWVGLCCQCVKGGAGCELLSLLSAQERIVCDCEQRGHQQLHSPSKMNHSLQSNGVEENCNINLFVVLSLNTWLDKYRITATVMDIFHWILNVTMIGKLLTFLSKCNMS